MPRVAHGSSATPEQLRQAHEALAARAAEVDLGFAVAALAVLQNFDFLFPELQDDEANLLPRSATTVKRLKELGRAMVDPGPVTGDGKVPAIYTYFGQFVDTTSPSRPAPSPPPSCSPLAWRPCPRPRSATTSRTCARPALSWTACTARRPRATRPTTAGC